MTIGADFKLTNISTTARQRANMSGWLHENQPYSISEGNLDLLCAIKAPSFHDRADKFLMTLERKTEFAGQKVKMEPSWQSASWSINIEELKELLNYLANERRVDFDGANCKIMPNGWARLDELRKVNADSEQCFVAMWFDDSIVPIYDEVIAKAILDAGYRPHRVDRREHNEKIDDEIIAQIRRSRFIVADFTDHRSGVYYEAGFAKGLGLEVILTCRKDDIENLHFDVRQYNCIDWEASKLPVFMKRLTDRIESVLGSGTYKR
jgi:nucleoside 2-deoxyribosyltransferase